MRARPYTRWVSDRLLSAALEPYPGRSVLSTLYADDLVALNVIHFRHRPDLVECGVRETRGIALDDSVVHMVKFQFAITCLLNGRQQIQVVGEKR